MTPKILFAALMALAGAAQAQPAPVCACNQAATRTANNAELVTLVSNKMVCGQVGSERWQEWHNGSSSGPIVDYKLGPGVQPDPSTTVGSYNVANNLIVYSYGTESYTYEVCREPTGNSYVFCGAAFGGRNIPGITVGGSGLQSCAAVTATMRTERAALAKTPPVAQPSTISRVPVIKP